MSILKVNKKKEYKRKRITEICQYIVKSARVEVDRKAGSLPSCIVSEAKYKIPLLCSKRTKAVCQKSCAVLLSNK